MATRERAAGARAVVGIGPVSGEKLCRALSTRSGDPNTRRAADRCTLSRLFVPPVEIPSSTFDAVVKSLHSVAIYRVTVSSRLRTPRDSLPRGLRSWHPSLAGLRIPEHEKAATSPGAVASDANLATAGLAFGHGGGAGGVGDVAGGGGATRGHIPSISIASVHGRRRQWRPWRIRRIQRLGRAVHRHALHKREKLAAQHRPLRVVLDEHLEGIRPAQVRERLHRLPAGDLVRARHPADLSVRVGVVESDGVLAGKAHLGHDRCAHHRAHQLLGRTGAVGRLVLVAHLHAGEHHRHVVFGEHAEYGHVSVAEACVEVAGGELGGVRFGTHVPVDAGLFGGQGHRRRQVTEHGARHAQHSVGVVDQLLAVPAEEPGAVLGVPHALVVAEEERLVGHGRVVTHILRIRRVAPGGHARPFGRLSQPLQHISVVALELADTAERPPLQLVRWISQFAGRPEADLHLHDHLSEIAIERASKVLHKVAVHLQHGAPGEQRLLVSAPADVLGVHIAVGVLEEYIVVLVAYVEDPPRQRDHTLVAHVAAALVERQHRLQFEAFALQYLTQIQVRLPAVLMRLIALHQPEPHVHHDTVRAVGLELIQAPLDRPPVVPPHQLRLRFVGYRIQWHHDEHRHTSIRRLTRFVPPFGGPASARLGAEGRRDEEQEREDENERGTSSDRGMLIAGVVHRHPRSSSHLFSTEILDAARSTGRHNATCIVRAKPIGSRSANDAARDVPPAAFGRLGVVQETDPQRVTYGER
eukprot:ctg_410.g217